MGNIYVFIFSDYCTYKVKSITKWMGCIIFKYSNANWKQSVLEHKQNKFSFLTILSNITASLNVK